MDIGFSRIAEVTIIRSRPANTKSGRQVVTLKLRTGSPVHVLGVTGTFKFAAKVTNLQTGKSWVEVFDRNLRSRAFPEENLIPSTWPSRPRGYTYGVGE